MELRTDHIIPYCGRQTAAGTCYSAPALCSVLSDLGMKVVLHTLAPAPHFPDRIAVRTYTSAPLLSKLGLSPAMKHGLRAAARDAAVIHNHGLWMMPNIYAGAAIKRTSCLLMTSPRGMMDPWAWRHHALRKRVVLALGQSAALRATACFHATAPMEAEAIRELGFRAPVAVVHNGVAVPQMDAPEPRDEAGRTLLFLSRIHPKKGIDILLPAWRNVQDRFPDWNLCIVGPDCDGHLLEMKKLAASLGIRRVAFTGRVPENEKSEYYRRAELYVLPTHADNWAVTVADALAHGIPAIVSRMAPWPGLEKHQCGWWIDNTVDSLTQCLRTALGISPGGLAERGRRGREWVLREFSWAAAGEMMAATYRWMLHGGAAPKWVLL